jgi:hypothetical protein
MAPLTRRDALRGRAVTAGKPAGVVAAPQHNQRRFVAARKVTAMSTPLFRCAPVAAALIACSFTALPSWAADGAAKPAKHVGHSAKAAHKAPAPAAFTVPDAQPEQVKAAEMVYYGNYDCEFQQTVQITQSPKYSAYVDVKSGKNLWLMKPVLSSTGAIRLEDVRGETLMVQIASKSMLLNVKTAHRIVDDCISQKQRELIAEAKAAKAAADTSGAAAPAPLLK